MQTGRPGNAPASHRLAASFARLPRRRLANPTSPEITNQTVLLCGGPGGGFGGPGGGFRGFLGSSESSGTATTETNKKETPKTTTRTAKTTTKQKCLVSYFGTGRTNSENLRKA